MFPPCELLSCLNSDQMAELCIIAQREGGVEGNWRTECGQNKTSVRPNSHDASDKKVLLANDNIHNQGSHGLVRAILPPVDDTAVFKRGFSAFS